MNELEFYFDQDGVLRISLGLDIVQGAGYLELTMSVILVGSGILNV